MAYALATSYVGEALLSGFNWFDGADPSHGFVSYQSRPNAEAMGLYSVDEITGVVRLGVDSTNAVSLSGGRPSIRLESKEAYNHGLFIADFLHMPPSQCGLWPAFWSYGPEWPSGGEVDIIEGANDQYSNVLSAHTAPGCTVSNSLKSDFSGIQRSKNCDVGTENVGCGYGSPAGDASAYGDGFNAAGGGVYAMEWDSEFIKIWHFARSQIPRDISSKEPNPDEWGMPHAVFGGDSCDVDKYFKDMSLVININFCGDWGNAIWGKTDGCGKYASTCSEYVAKNPQAFSNAYWDVRYIDAYQRGEKKPSPSNATSSRQSESASATTMASSLNTSSADTSSTTTTASSLNTSSSETFQTTTMTTSLTTTVTANGRKTANGIKVISYNTNTTFVLTSTSATSSGVTSSSTGTPGTPDTPQATISVPKNPLKVDAAALLGCYGSSDSFRSFRKVGESGDMTLERCVKLCAGSMFAGAFDTQCFCADSLDVNTRAVDAQNGVCDHACPGNDAQYCGGLAKKVGDLANTTAPIDPQRDGGVSSASAAAITASSDGKPLPTRASIGTLFGNSTQMRRFHDTRRNSLNRRESRPKNMLLTVYGTAKSDAAQPRPPPPPMAPGQNVTHYTSAQEAGTASTSMSTPTPAVPQNQNQVVETVVVPVPAGSTAAPSGGGGFVMHARPGHSVVVGNAGNAVHVVSEADMTAVQTAHPTELVEVVVEECGCETAAPTASSPARPADSLKEAPPPAKVAPAVEAAPAGQVAPPAKVAPPARVQQQQQQQQPTQNAPTPSTTMAESPEVPNVSVVTAGAGGGGGGGGAWSETRLSATWGLAVLAMIALLL